MGPVITLLIAGDGAHLVGAPCFFCFVFFRILVLMLFFSSHLSNVQNPVDIPLYWLVDRDPYTGLL